MAGQRCERMVRRFRGLVRGVMAGWGCEGAGQGCVIAKGGQIV